jgi:hypothetical protein
MPKRFNARSDTGKRVIGPHVVVDGRCKYCEKDASKGLAFENCGIFDAAAKK